jgi:hypothetical protein
MRNANTGIAPTKLHESHFFFALKTKKKVITHAINVRADSIGQLLNPQL